MKSRIRSYIEKANMIYILLDYADKPDQDALVILFHELMSIIIYGNQNQLISFSKRMYDLNIPVDSEDNLGNKIKNFILVCLNDIIYETLSKKT